MNKSNPTSKSLSMPLLVPDPKTKINKKTLYKCKLNISNDKQMDDFNSQYLERVIAIINQQGEMSEVDMSECENANFSRPKTTYKKLTKP